MCVSIVNEEQTMGCVFIEQNTYPFKKICVVRVVCLFGEWFQLSQKPIEHTTLICAHRELKRRYHPEGKPVRIVVVWLLGDILITTISISSSSLCAECVIQ